MIKHCLLPNNYRIVPRQNLLQPVCAERAKRHSQKTHQCRDPQGLPVTKLQDEWLNNTTVKVLVQNVQVLGTILPAVGTEPSDGEEEQQNIAILSVTPQQAELVRFAQLDGNLYLLLRSPEDVGVEDTDTTGITLRELVDRWGVLPPRVIITRIP